MAFCYCYSMLSCFSYSQQFVKQRYENRHVLLPHFVFVCQSAEADLPLARKNKLLCWIQFICYITTWKSDFRKQTVLEQWDTEQFQVIWRNLERVHSRSVNCMWTT